MRGLESGTFGLCWLFLLFCQILLLSRKENFTLTIGFPIGLLTSYVFSSNLQAAAQGQQGCLLQQTSTSTHVRPIGKRNLFKNLPYRRSKRYNTCLMAGASFCSLLRIKHTWNTTYTQVTFSHMCIEVAWLYLSYNLFLFNILWILKTRLFFEPFTSRINKYIIMHIIRCSLWPSAY